MPYMCYNSPSLQVTVANDGCIGLAILSYYLFELWERKVSCDGVAKWVLQKSVKLNTILGLGRMGGGDNLIVGYDEDDHVIYLKTHIGVCMVQLESMQFKNLGEDNFTSTAYFPYRSFYAAGNSPSFHCRQIRRSNYYFLNVCWSNLLCHLSVVNFLTEVIVYASSSILSLKIGLLSC
jgi:hypothetical protein